ncbi:hypothetical protein QO034_14380 [Sedimentitalea sp. JM2-8]|uniref:Uncharacterized protein n=1 Tax=Sedimentitalea xiamensis TaxID=3050037 RepID=A0ABT7FGX3_9RHOB|nr:hypothetical protein [Sedimentitalea xiamensis]MDK3074295.1 hypothetical protein [Sedimentitalea xiamensis]
MARLLHIVFWGLIGLYVIALFLWAVGTFGWFGQERDPLSAVFLVTLGLPWIRFIDAAPAAALPWLAALSPVLNIVIVGRLARYFSRS